MNNRLSELGRIVAKFEEIAADQRGEVKAVVTTAEGLSDEEMAEIRRGLAPLLKPGQKLTLEEVVSGRRAWRGGRGRVCGRGSAGGGRLRVR